MWWLHNCFFSVIFRSYTAMFLKWPKRISHFSQNVWKYRLMITVKFYYNCETNERNVSVTNLSVQQKMTEMSQRKKSAPQTQKKKQYFIHFHSRFSSWEGAGDSSPRIRNTARFSATSDSSAGSTPNPKRWRAMIASFARQVLELYLWSSRGFTETYKIRKSWPNTLIWRCTRHK